MLSSLLNRPGKGVVPFTFISKARSTRANANFIMSSKFEPQR